MNFPSQDPPKSPKPTSPHGAEGVAAASDARVPAADAEAGGAAAASGGLAESTIPIPPTGHEPVLLREVLELLDPRPGQVMVDCTLGRGGHARAIAERLGAGGLLIGLDADPRNLRYAAERLKEAPCPTRLFHANFAELPAVLKEVGQKGVDGILADLGLSTNQLFDDAYGLSFARDMPLDMRIDPRERRTAADLVNRMSEEDLANVLYELAQERYSRRIARKIGEARRVSPIISTERLADLVRQAIPKRGGAPERIDPATRTFMALRMAVNREMENLGALLSEAPALLKAGGRMAVISFQSMEDRAVKQAFRSAEQTGFLRLVTKKPLCATEAEVAANPRSRSAKLRVAQKTG
jgi:16S rRNA (cytosine1402-N4)-methyltransferase